MAKNMQPVLKRCRTLGVSPAAMGYSKTSNKNPGGQRRAKKSEYATQLTEKQKVKFVYGIQEKQFRNYYDKAARAEGNTGENLLTFVERRLDNVVYRLGFANSRRQARQLVNHGHFTVNGGRVNIPSYLVKTGDVIAVSEKSASNAFFKKLMEDDGSRRTLSKTPDEVFLRHPEGETYEDYAGEISKTIWNSPKWEDRNPKNGVLSVDASINPLKGLL